MKVATYLHYGRLVAATTVAAALGGCLMTANTQTGDGAAALITYDAPKEIAASPLYTVAVNGTPVFVYPCQVSTIADEQGNLLPNRHTLNTPAPAAFCYFDFAGKVEVEVTVHGPPLHLPLKSAMVRPLRHQIAAAVKGDSLRFSLARPCKLSVEPNGSVVAPLFIFANPREKQRPSSADPGVVYFPPGMHTLGEHQQVKSNSTLYIAGGAVVYGQMDNENLANVKVLGRGILDASRCTAGRQMRWFKCRDVTVDGIIMLDSPSWGIEVTHCDRVTIRNTKILTGRGADAIDVCSSEDVSVEDCFVRTHDDSLNVKGLTDERFGYPADKDGKWLPTGNRKAAQRISFVNCVVWNDRAHALMMGPETRAPKISDVLFRNIDIIHALSVDAIGIFSSDAGEISNIRYENVRIEDPRCMTLLEIRVSPQYTTADPTCGPVRDVLFANLEVATPSPVHSALCGDKNSISGVTFRNFRTNGTIMTTADEAKLHLRGDVKDVKFVADGE